MLWCHGKCNFCLKFVYNKSVDIKISAHDAFLVAFNVVADLYKMGRQKTIQWGGENVYIGADEKI